jgi:hypothetical protein
MFTVISSLVIGAAGFTGWPWWTVLMGTLLLLDRTWHAQHAYRRRFSMATATDVLAYATVMSVLQASLTATAVFGLGRLLARGMAG